MEGNDEILAACSSDLSELDVDAELAKLQQKKNQPLDKVSESLEPALAEPATTLARPQPPSLTDGETAAAPLAVTFAESKSYDAADDDMTADTNQAEGLDTVPSLDDGFKDLHLQQQSKIEGGSCNSGNYSNCSSADVTTRTRLETMDSTNIDSNHEVDCGYDVDHRNGDPLPPSRLSGASSRKSNNNEQQPEQPPSGIRQFARSIRKQWGSATKKLRNAMLHVLVETSVKAATYPRITIATIAIIAFSLIAMGYSTNFKLRLDNEKLFTPSSSEVTEFAEFVANFSMYEGVETDRRRALRQARALRKLREERKLTTTFNIFDGEDLPSQAPTVSFDLGANNKNSSEAGPTVEIEVVDESTNAPTTEATEERAPSNNGEQEEEEEERYYQRGHGLPFPILVHANTENIFTVQSIEKIFDIIEFVKNVPGYDAACTHDEWSFHNHLGENTCEIRSITRFWRHNRTRFREEVKTDDDLFTAADATFYPDGGYADLPFVLAEIEEDETGRPVKGQALVVAVLFKHPSAYASMVDNLLKLQAEWKSEREAHEHNLILEFVSPNSFETEVQRAVIGDLPLIPTVFVVMCSFTCLVFFKCHKVHSRSLLGIGAVVTIFLSILSGYGILFTAGVPMTVMTNLLVFVIFGIGLDDTFIITGAYFRTDHREDPVLRVRRTMEAVGSSILLTTITTSVAFILGCTSTIEPIKWLCLYAFPAIMIDFFYQITFFIAILVLDERRIQSNRMDCCICIRVSNDEDGDTNDEGSVREINGEVGRGNELIEEQSVPIDVPEQKGNEPRKEAPPAPPKHHEEPSDHIADRFMRWFASRLMHPTVKILVMVAFVTFAAICAYSTTKLRQQFNFKDLLPKDSYAASYATAVEHYSDRAIAVKVTFRFVDQSDENVRNQMIRYVDELVEKVDALNEPPPLFWVREFKSMVESDQSLQNLTFYEQIHKLLSNPTINDAYGHDLRFRDDGTLIASQVKLYVTDLNMDDVREQIKFFKQQREVTIRQPANKGRKLWAFFGYDLLFHIFAFYEVAAGELAVTTISSVTAVCIIAFLLIPHWSAVPIILPLLSVLYIEMMGILQMFGYAINVVTYVILVVSIGLLVDFIMHILLRYYESECETREEKVKDALGTMGASILVGGLSTFLGVTPLIFSASEIFSTVCLAFLAMVFLGVTHGLIVLPVILSYCGTESVIRHRKRLSLVQITHALSEKFHQSMDFSARHHSSLEIGRSKCHESELQV